MTINFLIFLPVIPAHVSDPVRIGQGALDRTAREYPAYTHTRPHTHTYTMSVPAGETAAAGPQKEGHLRKGPDGKEIPSVPLDKVRAGESTSTPDHNTPPERRERRARRQPASERAEKRAYSLSGSRLSSP